jgi:uncharacterized protein YjbJ (UPF0337 family)
MTTAAKGPPLRPSAWRSSRVGCQPRACRGTAVRMVRTLAAKERATMESTMNWDRVEGNWKLFTGKVKEQWGKLTDDELTQINGNREQLEGRIQARYGYARDQVRKEVDDWLRRQ